MFYLRARVEDGEGERHKADRAWTSLGRLERERPRDNKAHRRIACNTTTTTTPHIFSISEITVFIHSYQGPILHLPPHPISHPTLPYSQVQRLAPARHIPTRRHSSPCRAPRCSRPCWGMHPCMGRCRCCRGSRFRNSCRLLGSRRSRRLRSRRLRDSWGRTSSCWWCVFVLVWGLGSGVCGWVEFVLLLGMFVGCVLVTEKK